MTDQGMFNDYLGLQVLETGPTRVTGRIEIDRRHQQPYGIVHGGVYCAIVEHMASSGGAAAAAELGFDAVVGTANSTDFVRPHRSGPLDAVAEPISVGRTQQIWEVRISRPSDGKLVARGQLRLANLADVPEDRSTDAER